MVAQLDKFYKKYGYGRVARRLLSYAFFEGRPHTTQGQWFNPVVKMLLHGLAVFPGQPALDRPIVITGLGRSGTTILGKLLSMHKDIGFLNEPKLAWSLIEPRSDVCADYILHGGEFKLYGDNVTPAAKKKAYRIFSRYLRLTGARRLLDKYPEFVFRVDYLREIFPDVRIIFITRNGIDACQSVAQWSQDRGSGGGQGDAEDWWGRNDIKWRYICDQFVRGDSIFSEISKLKLDDIDHMNRAAIEWIITMRQGLEQEKHTAENFIKISYESLVVNPRAMLTELLDACELSRDNTVLQYGEEVLYQQPLKPLPIMLPEVSTLFNETMEILGYGSLLSKEK